MTGQGARPSGSALPALSSREFYDLMVPLAPFESSPVIAVGVSGGADSLALVYLLNHWAENRGGRAVALTVDHGLRKESASEAVQVANWMAEAGIEHHTLCWDGYKPASGIQAAARDARRNLLMAWCRQSGVLHLAFAHHMDDQAETYLMRLAHNSGPDGLSGMASVVESADVRIIRPLPGIAKQRLEGTLIAMGQPWLDDPSNKQDRFERTRVRKALGASGASGTFPNINVEAIASAMGEHARQRNARERGLADLLAQSLRVFPAGYATLEIEPMRQFHAGLVQRALARVLVAVGGQTYMPKRAALARLCARVMDRGRVTSCTLGHCRIIASGEQIMVCREIRNLPAIQPVTSAGQFRWDNRFHIEIADTGMFGKATLKPLGQDGWCQLVHRDPGVREIPVPVEARYSLPALFCNDLPVSVPHLMQVGDYGGGRGDCRGPGVIQAAFLPKNPVLGCVFPLAQGLNKSSCGLSIE